MIDLFENKQNALHQRLDELEALNEEMTEFVNVKFGGEAAEAYAPGVGQIVLPPSWSVDDPDENTVASKIEEKIEEYRDKLSNVEQDMPLPIGMLEKNIDELDEVVGDRKERLGYKTEDELAEEEDYFDDDDVDDD